MIRKKETKKQQKTVDRENKGSGKGGETEMKNKFNKN